MSKESKFTYTPESGLKEPLTVQDHLAQLNTNFEKMNTLLEKIIEIQIKKERKV